MPNIVGTATVENTAGNVQGTLSYAHTVDAAANKLVVTVGIRNEPTTVSVTYDGQTMSLPTGAQQAMTGELENAIFVLDDPPSGTHDVVVTMDPDRRATSVALALTDAGPVRGTASDDGTSPDGEGPATFPIDVGAEVGDFVIRSDHWTGSAWDITAVDGLDDFTTDDGVGGQSSRGGAAWGQVAATSNGNVETEVTLDRVSGVGQTDWAGVAIAIEPDDTPPPETGLFALRWDGTSWVPGGDRALRRSGSGWSN